MSKQHKTKRPIDANELERKFKQYMDFVLCSGPYSSLSQSDKARMEELDKCVSDVITAPTVDAEEVVHGRWIEKPNPWGQDGSHSYDCSICGERTCVVGHKLRYCPNCGAKMDGE